MRCYISELKSFVHEFWLSVESVNRRTNWFSIGYIEPTQENCGWNHRSSFRCLARIHFPDSSTRSQHTRAVARHLLHFKSERTIGELHSTFKRQSATRLVSRPVRCFRRVVWFDIVFSFRLWRLPGAAKWVNVLWIRMVRFRPK
jgi:hypothetical protein